MPLSRGDVVGYDVARMMFLFTMKASDARVVDCEISGAAIDSLVGAKGTSSPSRRKIQFKTLRDQIELIASEIFDKNNLMPVQIFAKHVSAGGKSEQRVASQPTASPQ
jgi:Protein of unknown function (DUF1488)